VLSWPVKRQVGRRPEEEREALPSVCVLNLLVKFECFLRGISSYIEHYEIVVIGLPEKSRCVEFDFMHLHSATSHCGSAHLARGLATIDEENSLAGENRVATKRWWAIHTTLPKRKRVS
jgi:hypothetical protein